MKILFTSGTSILSKAIVGVTEEPVSHCVLQFGHFIVHSNLCGVHLEWAANYRARTKIVYELKRTIVFQTTDAQDMEKLGKILEKGEHSPYDVGALVFAGLSMFLRKTFKVPLPKTNLWQSSGMFMCTEWVASFATLFKEDNSMITPFGLYNKLKATGDWIDDAAANGSGK